MVFLSVSRFFSKTTTRDPRPSLPRPSAWHWDPLSMSGRGASSLDANELEWGANDRLPRAPSELEKGANSIIELVWKERKRERKKKQNKDLGHSTPSHALLSSSYPPFYPQNRPSRTRASTRWCWRSTTSLR